MNDFLWVEKYRPQKVDECILPESVKNTFQSFIDQGEIPNLLLSGTAGVGKPTIAKAPSRFAAVGRYIFENKILDFISNDSGSGKEIEITDAIKNFVGEGNISQATLLKGECFDCGSKQGYFYSILKTGLSLPEYKKEVLKSLKDH